MAVTVVADKLINLSQALTRPRCEECSLRDYQVVYGKGPTKGIVVVGEAPGIDETIKGEPFVGYSGTLLRQVFRAAGIDPDTVYFTNACLCKPPSNRTPTKGEVDACKERLISEILAQQPERILLVGSTASEALLGASILKTRGRYYDFHGIPTLPTFHPSFILRVPEVFRDFAFDIQKLTREPNKDFHYESDGYPLVPYVVHSDPITAHAYLCQIQSGNIAIDLETRPNDPKKPGQALNERQGHIICAGLEAEEDDIVHIIPWEILSHHLPIQAFDDLIRRSVFTAHNADTEYRWIKEKTGLSLTIHDDTMLLHHSIDERSAGDDDTATSYQGFGKPHSLKTLGTIYYDLPDWSDLIKPYKDYNEAPKHILYRYLACDVRTTKKLRPLLTKLSKAEGRSYDRYRSVAIPSRTVFSNMSLEGVPIDLEYFTKLEKEWETNVGEKNKEFREAIGKPGFNPRSYKQVGELLFDDLKLPVIKKTKGGNRATGKKKVLDILLKKYDEPVLRQLGELRSLQQILSTFIKGIPKLVESDGRVHTDLLLHGTPTSRLASRHPNLQNIPLRIGSIIRDGFIAPYGFELVEYDFKSMELRNAADHSGDEILTEYVNQDLDLHTELAVEYFELQSVNEVTKAMRYDTKAVVYGTWYGREWRSIAEEFGLTEQEAKRRLRVLHTKFPKAAGWQTEIRKFAIEMGYVETKFGFRRRFPFVTRQNKGDIEREAIATPIQGTSSDINTIGVTKVAQRCDPYFVIPLLVVHDSFLTAIREGFVEEQSRWIQRELETPRFESKVKFKVDMKRGKRWGSLEEFELST